MSVSPLQIVLILVVVLILFGAGKLPKVMKDMGKGIKGFKDGLKEGEEEDETPKKKTKSKK